MPGPQRELALDPYDWGILYEKSECNFRHGTSLMPVCSALALAVSHFTMTLTCGVIVVSGAILLRAFKTVHTVPGFMTFNKSVTVVFQ